MIIRTRPAAWRLFFILRGSILPRIRWELATTVGIAIAVTFLHGRLFDTKITLTPIPFTLIGLALAIFLGFRNSASYDRWWEGRKLWGDLLIRTRTITRLLQTHAAQADAAVIQAMIRRLIGFGFALKHHLRGTADTEAATFLPPDERDGYTQAVNRPDHILHRISQDVARLRIAGHLDPMMTMAVEENLTHMAAIQAGCERIRSTPLPFSYMLLLHRTAHLYCLFLPFGLVDTIGFMTPFVVGLISYTFFGLDTIGDEIEEPFGLQDNDLPLHAICTRIQIDLGAALGESDLPAMPEPKDFCLM